MNDLRNLSVRAGRISNVFALRNLSVMNWSQFGRVTWVLSVDPLLRFAVRRQYSMLTGVLWSLLCRFKHGMSIIGSNILSVMS